MNDDPGLIKINNCVNIAIDDFKRNEFSQFRDNLSVINVNLRGLNSNFSLLLTFISELKTTIKVIAITESHLDEDSVGLFKINGYRKTFINRSKFAGGVIAYIHHSLNSQLMNDTTKWRSHSKLYFLL